MASVMFYSLNIWLSKGENFRACTSLPTPWEQRAHWCTFPQVLSQSQQTQALINHADTPVGRQSMGPGLHLVLRCHRDENSMGVYTHFKPANQTNTQNLRSFKGKATLFSFPPPLPAIWIKILNPELKFRNSAWLNHDKLLSYAPWEKKIKEG